MACTIVGAVDIFGFKINALLPLSSSSSSASKSTTRLRPDSRLKFYPCFSPKSNSLLSITGCRHDVEEDLQSINPLKSKRAATKSGSRLQTNNVDNPPTYPQRANMTTVIIAKDREEDFTIVQDSSFFQTVDLLMRQLKIDSINLIDKDTSLVILKSCKFSKIQSIENYAPMFKNLFTSNSLSDIPLDGFCMVKTKELRDSFFPLTTPLSILDLSPR